MKQNMQLKSGSGMGFEFSIRKTELPHFHDDIELIYVFEGGAELVVEEERYSLNKDDMVIVNANKRHALTAGEGVLLGIFSIAYLTAAELVGQEFVLFWCNSTINKSTAYDDVRVLVKRIANQYFEHSATGNIYLISLYYGLLHQLARHFLLTSKDKPEAAEGDERVERIMNYVRINYAKRIGLKELSQYLFLSEAYLSRYMKKQFGMNFLDYLNEIRMNYAVNDLIYTDNSVTQIALENGFANVVTFNRVFRQKFDMTPTGYRSRHRGEVGGLSTKEEARIKDRLDAYFEMNPFSRMEQDQGEAEQYEIQADQGRSYEKCWNTLINIGTASDLLKSNMQEHILKLKRDLKFRYVRFWDLYAPEMYIDINARNKAYNFDKLDRALDFLVNNSIYPYVELNVKPKKLLGSTKNILIEDERAIGFDNEETMQAFMEALILHLINRYGKEEVEQWRFEFWRDEGDKNQFNHSVYAEQSETYFRLFTVVHKALKARFPNLKLGGSGLSIRYGQHNFMEFLGGWKENAPAPDFLTLYCYPYVIGSVDGNEINKTSTDREFLKNYLSQSRELILRSGFQAESLHLSEWGSTVSNRNILNDSCYKGAYLMKNLIDNIGGADLIAYWCGSDIFADYYDSRLPLNGGAGLLSKHGIAKPAYYAFDFMNRLGSRLIDRGRNYIVTDSGYHEWKIACHNYKNFNYKYFMCFEDEIDVLRQDQLFEDLETKTLCFTLKGMTPGRYEVKTYSVNRSNGSVQDEWIKMAMPQELNQAEIDYLKQICIPRLSMKTFEVEGDQLSFSTLLEPHEIQFIHVSCRY